MNQMWDAHAADSPIYSRAGEVPSAATLKVLSLTSVYPTPVEPGRGLFVRSRLQHSPEAAQIKVMAPIWGADGRVPRRRADGRIEVLHPRWFYAPGLGAITAVLLFLQLIGPLRRLRREFPFAVLDAHFGYPEGIASALLARLLRVPFTVTLRGSELLHARYAVRRVCMGWALRRASRVIAVSEPLRQFAIQLGVEPARARSIPNGVDTTVFFPRGRQLSRMKHGLPLDRRIVLSAGHLIELKGHHYTIRAIKTLVDSGMPAQLLIAGGAPGRGVPGYEPELRRLIAELHMGEHVRLLGPVPQEELPEWMSAADVFCLASSREGWPNVVHEALACGTPVVGAKVGGVPDLLPRECYGLVVEPSDAALLAEALGRALAARWDHAEIAAWACSRSWEQVGREVHREWVEAAAEATR